MSCIFETDVAVLFQKMEPGVPREAHAVVARGFGGRRGQSMIKEAISKVMLFLKMLLWKLIQQRF